jgi:hypothetical protein
MADPGTTSAASPASSAVLSILQTRGPAPFVHGGTDWTLDLGQVQAGRITTSVDFGVLNAGGAGADALAVTSEVSGDAAFRVFGPPNYDRIEPSTGRGSTVVTLDAALPGRHEQTITLHPVAIAADGTRTPLPDETLRISMDVVGDLGGAGTIPTGAFSASLSVADPARYLASTPVLLGGEHFARIENLGSWGIGTSLGFAPSAGQVATYGPNYLLAVFQQVQADLTAGGDGVDEVAVVGGKGGALSLGAGDQSVTWSFASDGPGAGNTATIATGAGADRITLTAVGLDGLDDQLAPGSTLPYNIYPFSPPRGSSTYDGFASAAVVRPGAGEDSVDIRGKVAVTIELAPGDGQDTATGFVSGTGHILLHGVDPGAVSVTAAAQGGQAGTLVVYGAGDSIFLAGVSALGAGDILYDDPLPPDTGGTGTGEPSPVDWNAIAAQVLANHEATGRWFL